MDYSNNEEKITLRRCDLHAILSMLTMGNKKLKNCAWIAIDEFVDDGN